MQVHKKELEPSTSPQAAYGDHFRRLRERRGWTQDEAGERMGYSGTHISAVETGRRPPTPRFSRNADRAFGTGGQFERHGQAVRNTGLLEGFTDYVPLEMKAAEIRVFDVGIVPGLLQTTGYATALQDGDVQRGAITEQQAEERLTTLAQRQASLLRTPPPLLFVVLDEGCLLRTVGGPEVMAEQLDHLVEFAARPSTVVQVAPLAMGEHRSYNLPVNLLTLADRSQIAYAESAMRGQLVREPSAVHGAFTAYHQLQAEALSRTASVAMMRDLRKGTP